MLPRSNPIERCGAWCASQARRKGSWPAREEKYPQPQGIDSETGSNACTHGQYLARSIGESSRYDPQTVVHITPSVPSRSVDRLVVGLPPPPSPPWAALALRLDSGGRGCVAGLVARWGHALNFMRVVNSRAPRAMSGTQGGQTRNTFLIGCSLPRWTTRAPEARRAPTTAMSPLWT